jgi:hypothetical protein
VLVGEGFENNFVADAVDVALSDAYFKFFFHFCILFFVIFDIF